MFGFAQDAVECALLFHLIHRQTTELRVDCIEGGCIYKNLMVRVFSKLEVLSQSQYFISMQLSGKIY